MHKKILFFILASCVSFGVGSDAAESKKEVFRRKSVTPIHTNIEYQQEEPPVLNHRRNQHPLDGQDCHHLCCACGSTYFFLLFVVVGIPPLYRYQDNEYKPWPSSKKMK